MRCCAACGGGGCRRSWWWSCCSSACCYSRPDWTRSPTRAIGGACESKGEFLKDVYNAVSAHVPRGMDGHTRGIRGRMSITGGACPSGAHLRCPGETSRGDARAWPGPDVSASLDVSASRDVSGCPDLG